MTGAEQQVIYGLVLLLPSSLLGYLTYRRSKKVDAVTAQSGVATEGRAGTAQIIEGLNLLIDNLQDDNRSLREGAKDCDEIRRRLNRMNRKYGENGNGDIKIV